MYILIEYNSLKLNSLVVLKRPLNMLHSKGDLLERVAKGINKLSKRTITADDARILRIIADQVDAAFKKPEDPHIWAQGQIYDAFWIDYMKYFHDNKSSDTISTSYFAGTIITMKLSETISRELDDLVERKIRYSVCSLATTSDIHLDINHSNPLSFKDKERIVWHIMGYSQSGTGFTADRTLLIRKP